MNISPSFMLSWASAMTLATTAYATDTCGLLNKKLARSVQPFVTVLHIEARTPDKTDAELFRDLLKQISDWLGSKQPSIQAALRANRDTSFATGGTWEGVEINGIKVGVQTISSTSPNQTQTAEDVPEKWGVLYRHSCPPYSKLCAGVIWETQIILNRASSRGFDLSIQVRNGFLQGTSKQQILKNIHAGTPRVLKDIINYTQKYRVTTGGEPMSLGIQAIESRGAADFDRHVTKSITNPGHLPVVLFVADPYTGQYPFDPQKFLSEFAGRALIFTAGPDVHDELAAYPGTRVKKEQSAVIVYLPDQVAYYSSEQFYYSVSSTMAGLYGLMNTAIPMDPNIYMDIEQIKADTTRR